METSRSGLSLTDELTISSWPQGLCSHTTPPPLVGLKQICGVVVVNIIKDGLYIIFNIGYGLDFGIHTMLFNYEHLTISPVAAQCNVACGKRSSIECVHIDRCSPQKSWRWRQRSTLNLDSDKFRCFNYRDELDSTVFLPNFRLVTLLQSPRGPAPCDSDACYI